MECLDQYFNEYRAYSRDQLVQSEANFKGTMHSAMLFMTLPRLLDWTKIIVQLYQIRARVTPLPELKSFFFVCMSSLSCATIQNHQLISYHFG